MPLRLFWNAALLWGLAGVLCVGEAVPAMGQAPDEAAARAQAAAQLDAGDSLRAARQLAPARDAYRRARSLYRQVGDSTKAAEMQGNVGAAYYLDGQLEAARSAFQQAATEARAAGARAEAASNLNNMGLVEWRRGQYDAALGHIREAVRIHRALGNREQVASGLNNLANIQEERGRYDRALRNLQSSLAINREQDDRVSVANNLNNIGLILRNRGRPEAALERHREALKIHRALDRRGEMAADLNNIGLVLRMEERYGEALGRYREALEMNRSLGRPSNVANNLSNIGTILREQGEYEEALAHHRKALAIHREQEERARVATDLNNIGEVFAARGDREAALGMYRAALKTNRALDRRPAIAGTLENIGRMYLRGEAFARADSVFTEAVRVTDTLLQTASGDPRRDFLAKEIDRFQALALTRARRGRPEAALRVYERSRARLLAERLAGGDSTLAVPPVDSLRATVRPDEAAVLYANTGTEHPILSVVVTRDSVRTREVSAAPLRRAARRYEPALDRLRRQEEMPWIEQPGSLLREAKGVEAGMGAEGALANLVRLYRYNLSVPPRRQLLSPERRRHLGQVLYTVLVDPIDPFLTDVEGLVVVPDGALGYLPFEALSDWDQTRLVERWRVRYVQSLRVLHLLRRRDTPDGADDRRPLLALGGVVYDTSTTGGGEDSRVAGRRTTPAGGTATGRRETAAPDRDRPETGDGPASTYRRLGYGPDRWSNIPGTLEETQALRRITGTARLLTGRDASERALYRLSNSGALDDYRALHFATHGVLVPERSELSALVLSEVGQLSASSSAAEGDGLDSTDARGDRPDGYLSMREIATLDLNAEFVGLSACRTGLGRIYRGSGAVSLAQAFLRAGAGSVAVSLWSVYDASTSRFMQAVYRRAWDRDTSWAAAIAETKRAFIDGHHGERLRAPRFWAPFVHYGRDLGPESAERRRTD